LVLVEPEDVAPVEPLVPELLDVPAEPPADGIVLVELPDDPMPDFEPDVDEPVELPLYGDVLLELPPVAPMPEVEPELDAPPVVLLAADGCDEYVDDDEGLVEPVAEPPADPMPDAEPLALPVELQAARAAEQARARISLFIQGSPFDVNPPWRGAAMRNPETAVHPRWEVVPAAKIGVGDLPPGMSDRTCTPHCERAPAASRGRTRTFFTSPSGANRTTSSGSPARVGCCR
jgi:hypothetical protein